MFSSIPILALSAWLVAQPVTGPARNSAPQPAVVSVITSDARYAPLAEEVVAEVQRLFQPSEVISVVGPGEGGDLSILLWVGDEPPEPSSSDKAGLGTVWLDPVGRHALPTGGERHVDRRITHPFAAAVTMDLTALLGLWRGLSMESVNPTASGTTSASPRPRVLVPVDSEHGAALDIARAGQEIGLDVQVVTVDSNHVTEVQELLDGSERGDWVYFPPGSALKISRWVPILAERGLASFSAGGSADVHQGILAARSGRGQQRMARLAALETLSLIRGLPPIPDDPSAGAKERPENRPVIHLGTASKLGLSLPWRLRLSAELVGDSPASASDWTLEDVRRQAVEANLDLRARDLLTAADAQQLQIALAALRPQVSLAAEGRLLDRESAEASFGSRPERLVTAVGEASWILFSEPARAAVDITRRLQAARELELEQLRLDIELEAASLLLVVARGRAYEAIQRDHLDLTLARLDEARLRRNQGAAGRADIARLESKAARDRRALVSAYADRRELEIGLNRLLSLPLDAEILPRIPTAAEGNLPLEKPVARPESLARLQASMLSKSQTQAPETAAAAEVIQARERGLIAAQRSFFLPTAQGFGSWSARLNEGGAGTEPPSLPLSQVDFPETPSTSWTFGLGLRLPIYAGGERAARRAEAELQLEAARALERRATQQVAERVLLAVVRMETAYEAAFHAQVAVQAAERALEVVEQGYARGRESLTTWLDAQTELLSARLEKAAARYDALGQWMRLQRASGAFLGPADLHVLEREITSREPAIHESSDDSKGETS